MRHLWTGVVIWACVWLGGMVVTPLAFGQMVLTSLQRSNGVTTDATGQVFVHHELALQNLVTRFLPDGMAVGSFPIGTFTDLDFSGRLATDLSTGSGETRILDLVQAGVLFSIDPATGAQSSLFDLRFVPPDATAVYDIVTRQVQDFSSVILPEQITYGDVAVLRRGVQLDLYVTGVSSNTAFVLRITLLPGMPSVPRVLVASALTPAGTVIEPRGVAVNVNGRVLTTLPALAVPAVGILDSLVAFSADMEPEVGPPPDVGGFEFTSRGMATDTGGNFYVATGSGAAGLCGGSDMAALGIFTPLLDPPRCFPLGGVPAGSLALDVAVSLTNDRVYLTLTTGEVVFFPLPLP